MNLRERRRFLLHGFEHEEPLTVGGHVILGAHVRPFEELPPLTREKFSSVLISTAIIRSPLR
jgi:hypothetical protein